VTRTTANAVANGQTVEVAHAVTRAVAPGDAGNSAHPSVTGSGAVALAIGALGVVFGDIGTSPLYALQTVFTIDHGAVHPTPGDVYGVISLVFWSITVVVSIKYLLFVLRADNEGEGGVLALAALLRRLAGGKGRRASMLLLLGVFGASLFYGDSVITPAISVLSAVEGLKIVTPSLNHAVLPIGAVILALLFVTQRWGTHQIGRVFGPVMIVWFVVLGVLGVPEIARSPGILRGLSPTYIVSFVTAHPYTTFIAMGAVVLAITGAEALYADMGHFGRPPIRRAWFFLVFPALTLNYLGQGALILHHTTAVQNPFYLLAPGWSRLPLVILATFATVIASQAVISGAFSVSRQAVRLGFLPHLTIRQTSTRESGQIYVPAINWLLFAGVLVLMFGFRSSNKLATAYGVAVTGTLLITTTLFLVVARTGWRWPIWKIAVAGVVFGGVEAVFFAANLTKIVHGGWLPLSIAAVIFLVMTTWQRGRETVTARRLRLEGPLADFLDEVHAQRLTRVPGTAVFPHISKDSTPLALRANVAYNQVLHEHVVIVTVHPETVPYIAAADRLTIDQLGDPDDGIVHITARTGFQDPQDIPEILREACFWARPDGNGKRFKELDFDPETAFYFLSRISLQPGTDHAMVGWRKRLFMFLAHNAASPAAYFHLPESRTVVMGSQIDL
jgi:KUP system potassium uptake protein